MSTFTPKEIELAQRAYAAHPYAVRLRTSHCSVENRFDDLHSAIEYLSSQYKRHVSELKRERYRSFDARESVLILPCGNEIQCREFIGPCLSSY